MQSKKL